MSEKLYEAQQNRSGKGSPKVATMSPTKKILDDILLEDGEVFCYIELRFFLEERLQKRSI